VLPVTRWDMAETAHGGPFPEVLDARDLPQLHPRHPGRAGLRAPKRLTSPRALGVIGDIACDPTSDFSPVKVYDAVTDWEHPARRVHDDPPLDVMAIDNLPSLLPRESSEDYAAQLLPSLLALGAIDHGVWARAHAEFERHVAAL
jgi:saccharopine dehydrogenase (NAD+, L-lysine-forming)